MMRLFLSFYVALFILVVGMFACKTSGILDKTPQPEKTLDVAPYAIQHPTFNCDKLLDRVRGTNFSIAFLWKSFGESNTCLEKILPDVEAIEIHLLNTWCLRDGVCDAKREVYTGSPARFEGLILKEEGWLMERIRLRYREVNEFLKQTQTKCYVSTGLETALSTKANNVLVKIARQEIPKCLVVFNPIYFTTDKGDADLLEIHGEATEMAAPCIANTDGVDYRTIDVDKYVEFNSHCDKQFLWGTYDNCIDPAGFKPPHLRDCK